LAQRDDQDVREDGEEAGPELPSFEGAAGDAIDALRAIPRGQPDAIDKKLAAIGASFDNDPAVLAALNAYRSVAEFDRTGAVKGSARGPTQAALELEELQQGAVRFDVARAALKTYMAQFNSPAALERVNALLRGPGKGDGSWKDEDEADVQMIEKPGATATIVVFCDFRHRFNMLLNTFYHVWLANLPANVIFLRDWERLLYMKGVASMGDQKRTIAEIKMLARSFRSRKLVTMGNSGGGFGALEYAIHLGADSCIVFAPPIDLNYSCGDVGKKRMRTKITSKLVDQRDAGRIVWPDMPALYRQQPKTRAEIFFAEGNEVDRWHAETMKDLPNVKLSMVQDAASHGLLRQLAVDGRLEAAFREAVN
jgi:hypothetical protein